VGSCVIAALTPQLLANCSLVIRLPEGNLAGQFVAIQGPEPKQIALNGGTGSYRNDGGEGTLVEFGNGEGRLTLQVLSLFPEAKKPDRRSGHPPDSGGVRAIRPSLTPSTVHVLKARTAWAEELG
jgi:hypothetical protein